ncbi:MAG: transporter substrate-binding domain-containing protein [Pseudomonadota bacterium]
MRKVYFIIIIFSCCTFLISCTDEKKIKRTPKKSLIEFNSKIINRPDKSDLDIIKQKKQLRILVSQFSENHSYLPREKLPADYGANLAIQYAQQLGLEPVIVYASKKQLIPALIKGYGDVIASNLLVSEQRLNQIAFTHSLIFTYQQLIRPKISIQQGVKKDNKLNPANFHLDELQSMRIGVQKSEVYWQTAQKLKEQYQQLKMVIVDDKITPDEVLDFMVQGNYEATISDSQQIEIAMKYRDDIEVAYTINEKNAIAWGIRKENPQLLDSINYFIENYRLAHDLPNIFLGDFSQQKKKGQLRLITQNDPSSYFLWKNKLMGFEYDLIKRFALDHKLTLKVMVASDFKQMYQWLKEGRGDIVSAAIVVDKQRLKLPVQFTDAYRLDKSTYHWMVRKNNQQLLKALNIFIKKYYKSTFYNVTYNKYFKQSSQLFYKDVQQVHLINGSKISIYDNLIKKYSYKYKLNWLLVSALINQESKFDPLAKSWVGAKGLMQMMPKTAKKLQISHLHIPKNSIAAGTKYLHWIRKQFNQNISVEDKNWFSLAAYNAGIGHLQDARKLAKQLDLDPDRWFDNTERAMLLLAKNKYARKARYGYVRGSEAVYYVKQIRHIFQLYQLAMTKTAATLSAKNN